LVVLFIYGAQKSAQFAAIRQMRVYLEDLENDALQGSQRLQEVKRKHLIVNLILVVILTLLFILGLIRAISIR
jgi:hypothetical protein